MNLLSILDKLDAALDYLATAAPDALDQVLDAGDKILKSGRDLEAFLRTLKPAAGDGSPAFAGPETARVEEVRAKAEAMSGQNLATFPPALAALLAQIALALLDRLLKPKATP